MVRGEKKNDLGFVPLKIHLAATSLNKLLSLSEEPESHKVQAITEVCWDLRR